MNDALLYYGQPSYIKCWSDVYLHNDTREMVVTGGKCNGVSSCDFSGYTELERIVIGDNCFNNAFYLRIDGLTKLKNLTIGINSFVRHGYGGDMSFSLSNCPLLKEVRFGSGSFRNYILSYVENLPSLELLHYGDESFLNTESASFQSECMNEEVMTRFDEIRNNFIWFKII